MATVLIVDDEAPARALMRAVVTLCGHEAAEAASAEEALTAVDRRMPDLILLDLVMPGMGGWRFLDELYKRGLRDRTRVIIVTGTADPPAASSGRDSVRSVISKPFDAEVLEEAIEAALATPTRLLQAERGRRVSLERAVALVDDLMARPDVRDR